MEIWAMSSLQGGFSPIFINGIKNGVKPSCSIVSPETIFVRGLKVGVLECAQKQRRMNRILLVVGVMPVMPACSVSMQQTTTTQQSR